MQEIKVIMVDLPKKGLKRKVLESLASADEYNFEFAGGIRVEFPTGVRYHIWAMIPPEAYTAWELETVAQQVFDKIARKHGKESPDIASVGVEGKAMLIIESLGIKDRK